METFIQVKKNFGKKGFHKSCLSFYVKNSSPILILKFTVFQGNPDCAESTKVAKTATPFLEKSSVAGDKRRTCC